jgi:hypothetical protein
MFLVSHKLYTYQNSVPNAWRKGGAQSPPNYHNTKWDSGDTVKGPRLTPQSLFGRFVPPIPLGLWMAWPVVGQVLSQKHQTIYEANKILFFTPKLRRTFDIRMHGGRGEPNHHQTTATPIWIVGTL